MSRIFISYKRVDKDKVFKIKDQIEAALGEKCWIDLDGIESDAQFMNIIIKAINNCEVFLFMYSKAHSMIEDFNMDWTVREISFASKKGKRIVFINIDGTPLTDTFEFTYGTKQQIDGRDSDSVERLIRDLRRWNGCDKELNTTYTENNHITEDKSLISKVKEAKWVKSYLKDIRKRHWFVNLVLYGLEIVSLLALIPCFFQTLWSINLLTDPTWSLSHAYGKGFIPAFLIAISVIVCNGMVIRWNKNGFVYLFCLLFLIVLPTMYNEFDEFVVFSIFIFLGQFIYFCLLVCKRRKVSVWNSSVPVNKRNKWIWIFVSALWVFMLTILPLYMAKAVGFANNLYDNGARYLDARLSESSFYSHDFANRIGFSEEFTGRRYDAIDWYEKSILQAKTEKTRRNDNSLEITCDYLVFLCVNEYDSSIRELYEEACNDYGKDIVDNEIAKGSGFDYYITKSDRDRAAEFIKRLYDELP